MTELQNQLNRKNRPFSVRFSNDVFEVAPHLHVGLIAATPVSNLDKDAEVLTLLKYMEQEIVNSAIQKELISELPTIAAWRKVYSQFGVKPARYPCAAESLIRRVVEQGALARINTLVNLCNAISLMSKIPIASCDISGVNELIVLKAEGNERFMPIGKPEEHEAPAPGEIIYADLAGRAHSRRWNWRQSDVIKTTPESSQMLFTIEAVHPEAKVLVEATTSLLHEMLQPFTQEGVCERAFIHRESPEYTFNLRNEEELPSS